MDILQAARTLRPGTSWNINGDKLVQAEDGTPRVKPPTDAEIKSLVDSCAYMDLRAKEYPAIADQLDAIWKGGTDMDAMRKQIEAVKAKYPAPAAPAATIKGA